MSNNSIKNKFLLMVISVMLPFFLQAKTHDIYSFKTYSQEARFNKLVRSLRCLVCQNQNLEDSNAKLAQDFKSIIFEQVSLGKTEKEVIVFLTKRYGDFILFEPPFKKQTIVLWFGPFILLVFSISFMLVYIKRQSKKCSL